MHLLQHHWAGLERLPFVSLGDFPTPVQPFAALSAASTWIKRDDLSATPYGGNKIRKLEYLLGAALESGVRCIVTTGAYGSHHVLATAMTAKALGLQTIAVLVPQPWNAHVEENLRAMVGLGIDLHAVERYRDVAWQMPLQALRARLRGEKAMLIGPGGSNPRGTLGYVAAAAELMAQIEAGALPSPERIYIALGSGGSAVGLALGLAALGSSIRVHGVRVTDPRFLPRKSLLYLAYRCWTLLRRADRRFPDLRSTLLDNLEIEDGHLGEGYGVETEAGRQAKEAAAAQGIALEGTYTAKTLAALRAQAPSGETLYWHTYNSHPLDEALLRSPLPTWAERLRDETLAKP